MKKDTKKEITKEEINSTLNFLNDLKKLSDDNNLTGIEKLSRESGLKNGSLVSTGLRKLGFIRKENNTIKLTIVPEPIHARKLLEKIREIRREYNKNSLNKLILELNESAPVTTSELPGTVSEPTPKEKSGFRIIASELITFKNSHIELAGYEVKGDFTLRKLDG